MFALVADSSMSFADIRAKRQAKDAKSLVLSSSSSSSGAKPSSVEPPGPLFGALPPSIDIRSSPERGRGIYAKQPLKRGT